MSLLLFFKRIGLGPPRGPVNEDHYLIKTVSRFRKRSHEIAGHFIAGRQETLYVPTGTCLLVRPALYELQT